MMDVYQANLVEGFVDSWDQREDLKHQKLFYLYAILQVNRFTLIG